MKSTADSHNQPPERNERSEPACRAGGKRFQFQPQRGKASFKVRYREGTSSDPNCMLCRD